MIFTRLLTRLLMLSLCGGLLLSCTAPVTSAPTPTAVPPTEVPTATPIPPTATLTPVPPTNTPTVTPVPPTKTPTLEPTDTATPKPTNTKVATKAPTKRAATKAPTKAPAQPPANNSGVTSAVVVNTFPLTCRIVLWGPADVTLDASAEASSDLRVITPGVYGWRAFLGGAETGEAGNLEVPAGSMCLFKCDKETLSVRYGCR